MKLIKIMICVGMFVIASYGLPKAEPSRAAGALSSSICLRYPPSDSVEWMFYGNQKINVTLEDTNSPLGVVVRVTWVSHMNEYKNIQLYPYTPKEFEYSVFGQTPIYWHFNLSVGASVACIWAHAKWNPY